MFDGDCVRDSLQAVDLLARVFQDLRPASVEPDESVGRQEVGCKVSQQDTALDLRMPDGIMPIEYGFVCDFGFFFGQGHYINHGVDLRSHRLDDPVQTVDLVTADLAVPVNLKVVLAMGVGFVIDVDHIPSFDPRLGEALSKRVA